MFRVVVACIFPLRLLSRTRFMFIAVILCTRLYTSVSWSVYSVTRVNCDCVPKTPQKRKVVELLGETEPTSLVTKRWRGGRRRLGQVNPASPDPLPGMVLVKSGVARRRRQGSPEGNVWKSSCKRTERVWLGQECQGENGDVTGPGTNSSAVV